MTLTRRTMLKTSAATITGLQLWGTSTAWAGASDRVRIAVIGIHGMGQNHIAAYNAIENVQVAALCDIDESLFDGVVAKHFTAKNLPKPKLYTDIRKLLEDKDIDAVSVVTPNHWHTLASIWSIQAGKHVSVEKPCCHNIFEGQKLVEASRKYNVLVQDGAEQRSNPCAQSAAKFLQEGGLGEVYLSKGMCYKWRPTIGKTPDEPVPAGVHYDLWQGPAPERPFNRNRFHYNWHWNWDYGNGDIGNQGVHEVDIARWMLGVRLPTRVCAMGGHFLFDDDQQTPNTLVTIFEYPEQKKMLVFEVRHWMTNHEGFSETGQNEVGVTFFGSEGYLQVKYFDYKTFLGPKREPGPSGKSASNEYERFIAAFRSRKIDDLGVDIEDGHLSSALCHLGNIAYRVGRTVKFDPQTETFPNDPEASALLSRPYREPFVVPKMV
jgi:predicted dehydrogenase